MIHLIALAERHHRDFLEMVQEFGDGTLDGSGFHQGHDVLRQLAAPENFATFVQSDVAQENHAESPAPGRVRQSSRWIAQGEDEDMQLLGFVSIRHELNTFLLEQGGHIGYSVRPSARRQGVATAALRLALGEARALGIGQILLTCDETNVASTTVIERRGGRYEDSRLGTRRYWFGEGPWPTAPTA